MRFAYLIEPPFNDRDSTGAVIGHDVEIARALFDDLGKDFEPVETEFAELLPGVADGRWHMTTGLFATAERTQLAAFTHPIWALPDGLLVARGNPLGLTGYRSLAFHDTARIAVIRDQVQHHSAIAFGVTESRIAIFDTYPEAARAVIEGRADAYASVARAHKGFLATQPNVEADVVTISADEKPPASGAFAVSLGDEALLSRINAFLVGFLGSQAHRSIAERHGFSEEEVDLVAGSGGNDLNL
ncbi:MAG: transporter substrate-binding domain-containing protein [Pseudomonadota bacterium]